MGDRVREQSPVRDFLSQYVTSHPGQLNLAIPAWVGAMSTRQRAVTPWWLGSKCRYSMWAAGKTM